MKRILILSFVCVFFQGASGMQEALTKKDWQVMPPLLLHADSEQLQKYIQILLNTDVDLNQYSIRSASLLKWLLLEGCPDPDYTQDQERRRQNVVLVLKELIKHDKLNPDFAVNGEPVVRAMDKIALSNTRPYSVFLQQICLQVSDEKLKSPWHLTTMFHTSVSPISPNGFIRRTLKWHPCCLIVDYRVWGAVCLLAGAVAWFAKDKKQPDEQDDVGLDQAQVEEVRV